MQGSGDRSFPTGRGRILFVGAVHEAEPALRSVLNAAAEVVGVYTFSEKVASRTAGFVDLEPLAREAGVPVFRTANLNSPKGIQRVRELAPDLVVAVGWTRLLGDELLAIPPRGCVGFHASLLPRHRGRAPVNWAILRGERETGNTMMFLAPGADTGDIIDQRPVTIDPDDQLQVNSAGQGNPIQLTFTTTQGYTAKTITVTAIDDGIEEGDHTGTVTHACTSADSKFANLVIEDMVVPIADDEHFCGEPGQSYIYFDVTGPAGVPDCYVDFYDFSNFAMNWLDCTIQADPDCF